MKKLITALSAATVLTAPAAFAADEVKIGFVFSGGELGELNPSSYLWFIRKQSLASVGLSVTD